MQGRAFKKGKGDTCRFRVMEEGLCTTAVIEDIRFESEGNMHDRMSEGKLSSIFDTSFTQAQVIH